MAALKSVVVSNLASDDETLFLSLCVSLGGLLVESEIRLLAAAAGLHDKAVLDLAVKEAVDKAISRMSGRRAKPDGAVCGAKVGKAAGFCPLERAA